MTRPQDVATPPRWYVTGPLSVVAILAFAVGGFLVFGLEFGWSDGGRPPAAERLAALFLPTVLALGPALALLLVSVVRRPSVPRVRRSVVGAVVASIVLALGLLTIGSYVVGVAGQAIRYAQAEARPLLPEETAYTVEEGRELAAGLRDDAVRVLQIAPRFDHDGELSCTLSTGVRGEQPYAVGDILGSDYPEESIATAPDILAAYWEGQGYTVGRPEVREGEAVVDFTTDDGFSGSAWWNPDGRAFDFIVRGSCVKP